MLAQTNLPDLLVDLLLATPGAAPSAAPSAAGGYEQAGERAAHPAEAALIILSQNDILATVLSKLRGHRQDEISQEEERLTLELADARREMEAMRRAAAEQVSIAERKVGIANAFHPGALLALSRCTICAPCARAAPHYQPSTRHRIPPSPPQSSSLRLPSADASRRRPGVAPLRATHSAGFGGEESAG